MDSNEDWRQFKIRLRFKSSLGQGPNRVRVVFKLGWVISRGSSLFKIKVCLKHVFLTISTQFNTLEV